MLVNNQFPNFLCDKIIQRFYHNKFTDVNSAGSHNGPEEAINSEDNIINNQSDPSGHVEQSDNKECVEIFYLNQYSKNYKVDEKILRSILKRHVWEINVKIKLVIYYKSKTTSDLIIRNNISKAVVPPFQRSHLVYEYVCNLGECKSLQNSYIGLTNCTLEERLK